MIASLAGEVTLTAGELAAIAAARPRQINGLLQPGLVSIPVPADDRLARHPGGFVAIIDALGTFYGVALLVAVPIVDSTQQPAPHLGTRQCHRGENGEWWVILPGGRIYLLEPDEPYMVGDVLILFDVLDPNQIIRPTRAPQRVDVTLRGAA